MAFFPFLELQISLLASFQGCWTQWQRFETYSIHCFWDTPQHFLKTQFCLESGFLSFLDSQKSLLVSFQGCWTQWQRFETSSIYHLLRYPTAFSQITFLLRKWLSFIPRAPENSPSKFSRVLIHNGKDLKALAFTISEIPHSIFSKSHFCLESGFLSFLELQKTLLVSFQGCLSQWQRFESSSIHHFWDTPQHFLKTHFCLESGILSFLKLQKISTSMFSGVLNTMAKVWKL